MSAAQRLYEGVETDEGQVGLITYMRTDSVALSSQAMAEAARVIEERFGPEYTTPKGRAFKTQDPQRPGGARGHPADVVPPRSGRARRSAWAATRPDSTG